jgi:hypothetical protein
MGINYSFSPSKRLRGLWWDSFSFLFEFIRVKGDATFMKFLKGGASYKVLGINVLAHFEFALFSSEIPRFSSTRFFLISVRLSGCLLV